MGGGSGKTSGHGLDRELIVLGAVVVLGMIMAILDATIVNVAIPTLGGDLHASIPTVQWVMTGYLLALASAIPLTGWASARFGAKRVWIAALLLFTAGSALAGAAWSIESLIFCRVLQGLGAGMIMPVGQTILAQAAGRDRIGRVMSVLGIPMLLAPIFGPVIGGAIVDQVSWRWIFFVNLPIGVAAVALAWRLLPAVTPRHRTPLDWRGLVLLSPGIAIFVYGLSEAGAAGGVAGKALAGIAIGSTLVALFVWHAARRGRSALLDVSLFARRAFAAAAATNLLIGVALFGGLILLPLYYQLVRGESPLQTGLLLVPQGLGAALAMPIAGRLTDEIGARVVIATGVLVALAGIAVLHAGRRGHSLSRPCRGAVPDRRRSGRHGACPRWPSRTSRCRTTPSVRRRAPSMSSSASPPRSAPRSSPSSSSGRSRRICPASTAVSARLPASHRRSASVWQVRLRTPSARASGSPSRSSRQRSCLRSSSRSRRKPAATSPRSPQTNERQREPMIAFSLYDWLLFLHIVAAMVWVGGLVALVAFGTHALRSGDRDAVARFVGSLRVVGPFVLAPASSLVLAFGIWLVIDSPAWGFGQTWIWLALALVAAAVLVGALVLGRSALAAERAVNAGDHAEAATQLRRWSWGIRLILLLLVVATWDMVFKPGL